MMLAVEFTFNYKLFPNNLQILRRFDKTQRSRTVFYLIHTNKFQAILQNVCLFRVRMF